MLSDLRVQLYKSTGQCQKSQSSFEQATERMPEDSAVASHWIYDETFSSSSAWSLQSSCCQTESVLFSDVYLVYIEPQPTLIALLHQIYL